MKTEVKTIVEGLEVGMYVSRLDRPWIETPFLLEGINIKSDDDLEQLRKHCNYVYVDVEKGLSPDPRYLITQDGTGKDVQPQQDPHHATSSRKHPGHDSDQSGKTTYPITTSFKSELQTAKDIYQNINDDLNRILTDLKQDRDLDIEMLKKSISTMTESIVRNPAAMMWVISHRREGDGNYSRSLGTSVRCTTFGRHLGLIMSSLKALALGGLLLDIGNIKLPEELLDKSGHDAISLFARIAGIVDSYDAMTSKSSYVNSEPMSPHGAVTELYELRGKKYHAELVEKFIQAIGLYPTGSLVELNTGEVGTVVEVNGLRRLRPSIVLLLDKNKEPLSEYVAMDLSQMDRRISVSRGLMSGAYGIDMSQLFYSTR